jgi:N-acetyl-anhydromuramyl-L-alanine amidase AmpD
MSLRTWTTAFAAVPVLLAACTAEPTPPSSSAYDDAFDRAAEQHSVPRDLLVALSYSLTRLGHRGGASETGHGIHPASSINGGFGPMDILLEPSSGPDLYRAAEAMGIGVSTLQSDPAANIEAAASELRFYVDSRNLAVDDLEDWSQAIGWYTGTLNDDTRHDFLWQTYGILESGLTAETPTGETLSIAARDLDLPALPTNYRSASVADYPQASRLSLAHQTNFHPATRTPSDIDRIVIHTTQGSYSGAIGWFGNPDANVSSHYVVRSLDGEVTQSLWEEDIGWHAGHGATNARSVSIELEGYVAHPDRWYTPAMYDGLALLIRNVADRNSIPLDHEHILGHNDVPGCAYAGGGASCHSDPGDGFDWNGLFERLGEKDPDVPTIDVVGTGELVGFVREGDLYDVDAGVANAYLVLSTGQDALTDADGFFVFPSVPVGEVEISVVADGYANTARSTDVTEGATTWASVALDIDHPDDAIPEVPLDCEPTDWATFQGPSVTLGCAPIGPAVDYYDINVHWWDGYDWQSYWWYQPTDPEVTIWPVEDLWYSWSIRGVNADGPGEWSPDHVFYVEE